MTIDWLTDFEKRFSNDQDIQNLAARKLHGSVQINFCDGVPINYNLVIHRRTTVTYTSAANTSSQAFTNSTFTKGE